MAADLRRILNDAANNIERTIARLAPYDGLGVQIRVAQLQQALLDVRLGILDLYGKATPSIQAGVERATAHAADGAMALTQFMAEAATPGLAQPFLAGASSAIENVRSRMLDGFRLSPQVYKTSALSEGWVEREAYRGLAAGKSAKEIAGSVATMIRPDTPGGVSFAAMRLGRTELTNAFRSTSDRMAQKMPWVIGEKWELSGSHPREDECDDFADADTEGLGGGVYSPGNLPDSHPQCLCYTTDIVIDPSEFLDNLVSGAYDNWTQE
jgi:hypothetical protein